MNGLFNSDQVLAFLEQAFPDRLPTAKTTAEEFSFLQGQRSVVDLLKSKLEEDPMEI